MLARIPEGAVCSVERQVFPDMVAEGCLYARESDAYWVDAGTPVTYLAAQLDLIDGVRGIAETALASDADVHAGAAVHHSVVGTRAIIEAGAEVRDSVIGAGARIGAGTQVVDSVVGDGAVVGSGATLEGLALIGQDVTVPDNTHLDGGCWPPEDTWEEPA
jgi:mannose-1-phosphate guanylyltransferase